MFLGTDSSGQLSYLQSGGDLISAVNGPPIQKIDDLLNCLKDNTSAGQRVQFSVLRAGGQQQTTTVTLGTRPAQTQSQGG